MRISAAVVLIHAGVIWLLIHQVASSKLMNTVDHVILATVVTEVPDQISLQPKSVAARAVIAQQPPRPVSQHVAAPEVSKFVPNDTTPNPSPSAAASVAESSAIVSTYPQTARPTTATPTAVMLPSSDADYLNNPPPAYPRMSRRMGEQGTVLVRVFITADGLADKAEVRSSSGYTRLDEAALNTVQRWRFVPGKRAGQPEAMWFNIPIRFMLD